MCQICRRIGTVVVAAIGRGRPTSTHWEEDVTPASSAPPGPAQASNGPDGGAPGQQVLAHDWAATPLGPIAGWPASLRAALEVILAAPGPMWLAWGDALTWLGNDACAPLLAGGAAGALGQPADRLWPQAWPDAAVALRAVRAAGRPSRQELRLPAQHAAAAVPYRFACSPLPDDAGGIGGVLCVVAPAAAPGAGLDRVWLVSTELMAVAEFDGRLKSVNPAWQTLGHDEAALLARPFVELIHEGDLEAAVEAGRALRRGPGIQRFEARLKAADGAFRWFAWTAVPDGEIFYAVGRDVSDTHAALDELAAANQALSDQIEERAQVEQALRQAQKMETIGQLTGGVAHDFNNLLTVIIGNLETLERQLDGSQLDPVRLRRSTEHALRGARRAASLTQSLLAFARRQPLDPRPVDSNRLVAGMSDLLRRTLGETIQVETVLAAGLWPTHADPNQLESAILNLAVNGRDAMAAGGRLTIETANAHFDDAYAARQEEVTPGQYILIAVTDTGIGMTREVAAQAFEPFFTTKDIGHGTGLGLSQVYGFVRQSGGHVRIYSEPGHGTTVKIYLPRLLAEAAAEPPRPIATAAGPASTILLVEDDEDVRAHSAEILAELGYRVLEAANGRAALALLERHGEIGLLFTDIGLPGGMNGRQLADEARRRRPDLPVLLATGYASSALLPTAGLDPGVPLITKPFGFATLAARLQALLPPATPAAPPAILVVEDEALVRMFVVEELADLGWRVAGAASAAEALSRLRDDPAIAAAVIDMGLPDRPGDELAAELRALRPGLPMLIASGYDLGALRAGLAEAGQIGFLGKPYTGDQLALALRAIGIEPPSAACPPGQPPGAMRF
jgi:PAS domain S-box-containing protein